MTSTDGSFFADLGFPPEEAENLTMRARLITELWRLIAGTTQPEAAALLGIPQPRMGALARGRIDMFTIDTPVSMLGHAGPRMHIFSSRSTPPSSFR